MFRKSFSALSVLALAACGQQQPQGFHGFPPAHVTIEKVTTRSLPVTFEYTGQTIGSKDVEVRARVTGIVEQSQLPGGQRRQGGTGAVRDRSQALPGASPRPRAPTSPARRRRRRRPTAKRRG